MNISGIHKLFILLSLLPNLMFGVHHLASSSVPRIFWDIGTQRTIFSPGNYARMIQLLDGRLMAVAQIPGGIGLSTSIDLGNSWSESVNVAKSPANVRNSVPDIIQLRDGTIIVGYNPRPEEPYDIGRKFGLRLRRSIDNGQNWSDEIFIYDAQHTFNDGCWEPSFLELPSGELQCYFANENDYQSSNEQNISMCRSYDKGLTWTSPIIISYRNGFRDGMPVPLLLNNNNDIVVAIEDNGVSGHSPNFYPVFVRNNLIDNWNFGYVNATSIDREIVNITPPLSLGKNAAAPYIRKLPTGEVILSYQGSEGRNNSNNTEMFVLVGSDEARNFRYKSTPFNLPQDKYAKWNSVSVIDTGIVVALTSTNRNGISNQIIMMKGYPIRNAIAKYGNVVIDGEKSSSEKWSTLRAEQLIFGSKTGNRWVVDFLHDQQYLYFMARVVDRETISNSTINDGVRLLIDIDDTNSSTPQKGTYNLFFDINNQFKIQQGRNGLWETMEVDDNLVKYAVNVNQDRYYFLEAAIPWLLFGKEGPVYNQRMSIAIELFDRLKSSYVIEGITGTHRDAPNTWLNFFLEKDSSLDLDKNIFYDSIRIFSENDFLIIQSAVKMKGISVFNLAGNNIINQNDVGTYSKLTIGKGTFVIKIILPDNHVFIQKIII